MDFKKRMGKTNKDDAGKRIDARPDPGTSRPQSIRETKVWKQGSSEVNRAWSNYKTSLIRAFKRLSRVDQESLITQICMITTMGVSMLLYMFIYPFLPLFIRLFALPLVLIGSYWAGTKLVAPIMIVRFDSLLNPQRFVP